MHFYLDPFLKSVHFSSFTDFDECVNKTSGCNQICTNTLGSYNCSCFSGYQLKNKTYCGDINECTSLIYPHNCHAEAVCTNVPGTFNCTCKPGFFGNGTFCQGKSFKFLFSSAKWENMRCRFVSAYLNLNCGQKSRP